MEFHGKTGRLPDPVGSFWAGGSPAALAPDIAGPFGQVKQSVSPLPTQSSPARENLPAKAFVGKQHLKTDPWFSMVFLGKRSCSLDDLGFCVVNFEILRLH